MELSLFRIKQSILYIEVFYVSTLPSFPHFIIQLDAMAVLYTVGIVTENMDVNPCVISIVM